MRIALISTPTQTVTPNLFIPYGILSLAAFMEQQGHEVHLFDEACLREPKDVIVERLLELNPEIIGVGGIITAYRYILSLTLAIKHRLPNIPIVVGGQVVTNNVRNCFRHMGVDYLVHGYGEIALSKLAHHLAGGCSISDIPGVSFRQGNKVVTNRGREFFEDINSMPFPAYHLADMEHYIGVCGAFGRGKLDAYLRRSGKKISNYRFANIMGTLGCTDKCSFCVHEQEFVGLKMFSYDYLIKHIGFIKKKYDVHVLFIGEEMFLTTLNRAKTFNQLMKDNFPDIYWATSTRADFISEELIHELETGNCYQVGWGFESGSQKVLNLMKKRVRRGTNINAYRIVDQSNLIPSCSLMVGNVGEDNDTVKETVDAIRIAKFTTDGVFYAAPYPGSRIWDWAVERGIIKNTHEYLMSISDVGAVVLQTNMTPFPDWVLKAWNKLLGYECKFNENAMWRKNLFNRPWHGVINDWIALYFGIRFKCLSTCRLIVYPVPSGLPIFAISPLLEIFFIYDKIRRRFHITERDKKYEYSVDKEGALLPENHNTGLPQRAMKNERVEKFLEVCPRDVIDI